MPCIVVQERRRLEAQGGEEGSYIRPKQEHTRFGPFDNSSGFRGHLLLLEE